MLMLVILSPACLPRLRNNEESEDDAGDADRENADKDGGEAVVGVEHVEQLGGDKTEKPERTVVQASHCLLIGPGCCNIKSILSHLISWLEQLAQQGVPHWSKPKVKGSKKEDEDDDDQNIVTKKLVEEGAAKDQSVRVGGNPEDGGKDDSGKTHARATENKEYLPGKWKEHERWCVGKIQVGPAQSVCSTHLKTRSNNNSKGSNLKCKVFLRLHK